MEFFKFLFQEHIGVKHTRVAILYDPGSDPRYYEPDLDEACAKQMKEIKERADRRRDNDAMSNNFFAEPGDQPLTSYKGY